MLKSSIDVDTPVGVNRPVAPRKQPARPRPQVVAVDDETDSLRLLQIRLEAGGMQCYAFSDGQAALTWLEKNSADVVILDVMMPRIDGYELCRRMKANPATRDIPVIFLTAKLESSEKVRGLEIGGHDYLTKPVQQQELLARTRAAVRVKQLQDQLKEKIALQEQIYALHSGMLSEHWLKTLGQLATSLAHEINNPLAAALGHVQLLRMRPDLDESFEAPLDVVDQSLQRAGHKLRSLLLIAQVGHCPEQVELHQLILDLVAIVNVKAVMNKAVITTNLDADSLWTGAKGDMARALLYILNNAIEATREGGSHRVHISLRSAPSGHCITISDNGHGVDPAVKGRIFEPFFTTKPPRQGIGLHLAFGIIEEANGTIEVISPARDWSTSVRICLPADQ